MVPMPRRKKTRRDKKERAEDHHAQRAGFAHERAAPEPAKRLKAEGERDLEHSAFLVWALPHEANRSLRATARVIGRAEGTVRRWKERWQWTQRARSIPDLEHWCARLLRFMYPRLIIPVLSEFPTVSGLVAALEDEAAEGQDPKELFKQDPDAFIRRMNTVIRTSLTRYAQALDADKVTVRPSDIPGLYKTWALLNGDPTQITQTASGSAQIPDSVRVQKAKEQHPGDESKVLEALAEEIDELQAIVQTMRAQDEFQGQVITFPVEKAEA